MHKDRPDFVELRLSDAALKQLGDDATVRITSAHMHYVFTGSLPVEVQLRGELQQILLNLLPDGAAMFQVAEMAGEHTSSEA